MIIAYINNVSEISIYQLDNGYHVFAISSQILTIIKLIEVIMLENM